jgi:EAL and modified HD-GYP domain-containing signal transduction protein
MAFSEKVGMDVFIARQPIFNRQKQVFGYELLFRSSWENFFNHPNLDLAASRLIGDSTLLFGIDTLTGNKRAFINITRDSLLSGYAALLPQKTVVLEILETVEPDAEVIDACRKLKADGFTIALDDFVYRETFSELLEIVDLVKVDWLASSLSERRFIAELCHKMGKMVLAEKIETQAEYQEALDMGYHFFQGYFFSKPVVLAKRGMSGNKFTHMRVLKEIHRQGMDYRELESIIKTDLGLSYKLLRYINSAYFGLRGEVRSIRHALVLIGEAEIKKWATLLSLSTMGEDKPPELVHNATVRARLCEVLAEQVDMKRQSADFFLVGLFSVIDAIMDATLEEILAEVPITHELKDALLNDSNSIYRLVLNIAVAYEYGDWPTITKHCKMLRIKEQVISQSYLDAVDWARKLGGV